MNDQDRLQTVRIINGNGPAEMSLQEVMRRKRLYEKFGVTPQYVNVPDGVTGLSALREGRGDVCLQIGFGPALAAIEQGVPLRIIAGANLRTVHVLFTSKPEIRSVKDLEGHTVGIGTPGALTHQLTTAILLKKGADPSKVKFVSVGNSAMGFKAVVAGKVDAALGEVDTYHQQEELGVRSLPDGDLWNELPDFTNQASYTTLEALKTKRDLIVRALAASAELYRFVSSPTSWDEFFEARMAALPDSEPGEAKSQWSFYQERKPFAVNLVLEEARTRYMQEVNIAMGLQTRVLDYSAVADMSLAEDALKMVGRV